jgi:hypothetical protein
MESFTIGNLHKIIVLTEFDEIGRLCITYMGKMRKEHKTSVRISEMNRLLETWV